MPTFECSAWLKPDLAKADSSLLARGILLRNAMRSRDAGLARELQYVVYDFDTQQRKMTFDLEIVRTEYRWKVALFIQKTLLANLLCDFSHFQISPALSNPEIRQTPRALLAPPLEDS